MIRGLFFVFLMFLIVFFSFCTGYSYREATAVVKPVHEILIKYEDCVRKTVSIKTKTPKDIVSELEKFTDYYENCEEKLRECEISNLGTCQEPTLMEEREYLSDTI